MDTCVCASCGMTFGGADALARHRNKFCVGGRYDSAIAQAQQQKHDAAGARSPTAAAAADATSALRILRAAGAAGTSPGGAAEPRASVTGLVERQGEQDRELSRLAAEISALKARAAPREAGDPTDWAAPRTPLRVEQSPRQRAEPRHGRRGAPPGRPRSSEDHHPVRRHDDLDARRSGSASGAQHPQPWEQRAGAEQPSQGLSLRLQADLARLRGALEARGDGALLEQLAMIEGDLGIRWGNQPQPHHFNQPYRPLPNAPSPIPQLPYGPNGWTPSPLPWQGAPQPQSQLEQVVAQLTRHAEVVQQSVQRQQDGEAAQLAAELAQLRKILERGGGRRAVQSPGASARRDLSEEELQQRDIRRMDWELARMERQELLSEARLAMQRRREDWERDRDEQERARYAEKLRQQWNEQQQQLGAEQALRRQLAQQGVSYQPPPPPEAPGAAVSGAPSPPRAAHTPAQLPASAAYDSAAGLVVFFDIVNGLPRPGDAAAAGWLDHGRGREVRVVYAVCDGARPVAAIRELAPAPAEAPAGGSRQCGLRCVLAQKRRIRSVPPSAGVKLLVEVQLVREPQQHPGEAPRTAPFGWSALPLFDPPYDGLAQPRLATGAWRAPLFFGPVQAATHPSAMLSAHTRVVPQSGAGTCELLLRVCRPADAAAAAQVPVGASDAPLLPQYALHPCYHGAGGASALPPGTLRHPQQPAAAGSPEPAQQLPPGWQQPGAAQQPLAPHGATPRSAAAQVSAASLPGAGRPAAQQHSAPGAHTPPERTPAATALHTPPEVPAAGPAGLVLVVGAAAAAVRWLPRARLLRRWRSAVWAARWGARLGRESRSCAVSVGVQPVEVDLSDEAAAEFGAARVGVSLSLCQRRAAPQPHCVGRPFAPREAPRLGDGGRARWARNPRHNWAARVRLRDAAADSGSPLGVSRPRSGGGGGGSPPVFVLAELYPAGDGAGALPVLWGRAALDAPLSRCLAPLLGRGAPRHFSLERDEAGPGFTVAGTRVDTVTPGSAAAREGLAVGMRVLSVAGRAVDTAGDAADALQAAGARFALTAQEEQPCVERTVVGRLRVALRPAPADPAAPVTPRRQRADNEDRHGMLTLRVVCRAPPGDGGHVSDPDYDPADAAAEAAAPPAPPAEPAAAEQGAAEQPRGPRPGEWEMMQEPPEFRPEGAQQHQQPASWRWWAQPLHVPCTGPGLTEQPLLPGDEVDVHLDGARWLPLNVGASRVSATFWQFDRKSRVYEQARGARCAATQALKKDVLHPSYGAHVRLPRGPWDPTLFMLCELRGLATDVRAVCAVGYCVVPLFARDGQPPLRLRAGARAVRVRAGPLPPRAVDPELCSGLPPLPPCCSLLVRVERVPSGSDPQLAAPKYVDGAYDSSEAVPSRNESRAWRRRKEMHPVYVEHALAALAPPGGQAVEAEALREAAAAALEQPGEPPMVLDYSYCVPYGAAAEGAIAVRPDSAEGVPIDFTGGPCVHKVLFRAEGAWWNSTAGHHWGAPGAGRSGDRSFPCWRDSEQLAFRGAPDPGLHVVLELVRVSGWGLGDKTLPNEDSLQVAPVGWCRHPLFASAEFALHGRIRMPLINGAAPSDPTAAAQAAEAAAATGAALLPRTTLTFSLCDWVRRGELPQDRRPRKAGFPPGTVGRYPDHPPGDPVRLHTVLPRKCTDAADAAVFEQSLNAAFVRVLARRGVHLGRDPSPGTGLPRLDSGASLLSSSPRLARHSSARFAVTLPPAAVPARSSSVPGALPPAPPPGELRTLRLRKSPQGTTGLTFSGDLVTGTRPGGAAEAAGVQAGMRLVKINGVPADPDGANVAECFRSAPAEFDLQVALPPGWATSRPDSGAISPPPVVSPPRQPSPQPQLQAEPLAERRLQALQIRKNAAGKVGVIYRGPVVTELRPGGPGEQAGLVPGMRLVTIAGRPVDSQASVAAGFAAAPGEFEVTVLPPAE
eukprot:TRINITY_DN10471_c0_g1_i2.p1 TRINITY_DN10471_c0_g1~~TRINITY_DN10471_c0_g1_i2.p1  ORF type:complete len:1946 (+),score=490.96 TRINITY_DN10471_c0_g1_i2:93-5930(+)